jgi:hypothetical protein
MNCWRLLRLYTRVLPSVKYYTDCSNENENVLRILIDDIEIWGLTQKHEDCATLL